LSALAERSECTPSRNLGDGGFGGGGRETSGSLLPRRSIRGVQEVWVRVRTPATWWWLSLGQAPAYPAQSEGGRRQCRGRAGRDRAEGRRARRGVGPGRGSLCEAVLEGGNAAEDLPVALTTGVRHVDRRKVPALCRRVHLHNLQREGAWPWERNSRMCEASSPAGGSPPYNRLSTGGRGVIVHFSGPVPFENQSVTTPPPRGRVGHFDFP